MMQRHLLGLLVVLGLFWLNDGLAQRAPYQELPTPQRTEDPNTLEVIDFFWYGCGHCYNLYPVVKTWKTTLPDDVRYRKIPAAFRAQDNDVWAIHARIFYTAQALGIEEQASAAVFEAIHQKRQRLTTEAEIAALFGQLGVQQGDFERAWRAFGVRTQVNQSVELSRRYRLEGVPTLIVNGRYVTGPGFVPNNGQLLGIINELLERERQAKAAQATVTGE